MNNYYNNQSMYAYNMNQNLNKSKFFDPYAAFLRGNIDNSLYVPYNNMKPYEIMPINDQAKMLTSIDALSFAMLDLNLYLDVNPNDEEAIKLFNQYRVENKNMITNYENLYGPLTIDSDVLNTYPWMWNERPWPWER